MSWNYRIVKFRHTDRHAKLCGEEHFYGLHEVYYDEDGNPNGYTEHAVRFECGEDEGPEGIIKSLERALESAKALEVLDANRKWPKPPEQGMARALPKS
jgi:hypothetical protein